MTNESPNQSHQDMSSKSSELSSGESLSPASSPAPAIETLKRHREPSEADESDTSPPSKTPKMAYSIMNILAKDKKDPKANKENSLAETHSVSPAPANTANTDTSAQPLNPFFLNPFLAAAAAAAQPGQSSLLHNISNLAMLSKNQSSEMWPWFNMAAMSALYGLDKGYTGLFPPIDNSNLRNLSSNSHTSFAHTNGKSDEHARLENVCQRTNKTVGPNDSVRVRSEVANRCVSHSSSCSVSPSSKYGFDETGKKIENRKLLNRSLDDEDGNRLGFSGASMGDEDDLDDDNEAVDDDEDGSNNGDSFDNMRKKKTRTVFSRNQVFQLESTFDMKRYLSSSERSSLANSLQLTETQIKIWFQNRRNKWKRQLAAEIEANGSNQHQQTQHQLSVSSSSTALGNQQRNSSNQRIVRVPVLYQSDSQRSFIAQDTDHVQSSSSSTHSSLASPSNSSLNSAQAHVNPASLLSPSMLAAAAAASSLYYAAAAHAQPAQFQNFNLNIANNSTNNGNKQSISSIL